jgi:hypothetical protein
MPTVNRGDVVFSPTDWVSCIFRANVSVGPTALNTSMLAIAVIANVAAAATIAIASRNTLFVNRLSV